MHWLFPQLPGASWKLSGQIQANCQGVRVEALHVTSKQVDAHGALTWRSEQLSGALVLASGQTKVGIVLDGGEAQVVLSPASGWLERVLDQTDRELSELTNRNRCIAAGGRRL